MTPLVIWLCFDCDRWWLEESTECQCGAALTRVRVEWPE
jgi:hypothetical protein